MGSQPESEQQAVPAFDPYSDAGFHEPGLTDAIRFLYRWRVKLAFFVFIFFGLGVLVFFLSYFSAPKMVEGIVGLDFHGIERSEYPSGRRFTVEDLRSPGVLTKALEDASISPERTSLQNLLARMYITPIIPAEIQSIWKRQEQAGTRKDEYAPSQFRISLDTPGLTDPERIRLFDAIISRYRESVRYEQKSAKTFISLSEISYDKLAGGYDLWDIPALYREACNSLREKLDSLIDESMQFQNSAFQMSFREIARDLDTWERTRLQTLEALTYQGRLVGNPDLVLQRIQYNIKDLDIQIREKSREADEALRLLEAINRPTALLAGQLAGKEGTPVIGVDALDKLLKSDFVGPVVQRISRIQEEIRTKQEEKARLETKLSWLSKSSSSAPAVVPPAYKDLSATVCDELKLIVLRYDRILEEYLTTTITSLISVRQFPIISRSRYSPALALPLIALLSIFLGVALLGLQHLYKRAKEEEKNQHR